MIADSDTVILVSTIGAAVIGAIVTLITTMMNIASANRRQRRELQYRGRQPSVIGLPFIITVILIVAVIYLATRPNDEAKGASEATAPATTVVTAPTATTSAPSAVPTSTVAPATTASSSAASCAAFTVQIAALGKANQVIPEFEAQARLLTRFQPQLGELHSGDGAACGTDLTQFYFGPFANADAARDACFAIGRTLHDNIDTFTHFRIGDDIAYPYYRVTPGLQVRDRNGDPLVCAPGAA